MPFLFESRPYTRESKKQAVNMLRENTVPDRDFYILVIGAIILAASGILVGSIPVLIASMIVAPLAYPILSISLGIVASDSKLFIKSLGMLIVSIILAIVIGGLFSFFTKHYIGVAENTLISFFPNVFFDLLIAVLSGAIAAYGLVRLKVGGAMTGIGIAVSLMPPLVAVGIGIFNTSSDLAMRAGTIFLYNFLGIIVGIIIMFLILGIGEEYRKP